MFGKKSSNGHPTSAGANKHSNSGSFQQFPKRGDPVAGLAHTAQQRNNNTLGLPRSHNIESLIRRVAEKESKERFRKTYGCGTSASMYTSQQQRLQVCDGHVRAKMAIFDPKLSRNQRSRFLEQQKPGHVKAKMAIFDPPKMGLPPRSTSATTDIVNASALNKANCTAAAAGGSTSSTHNGKTKETNALFSGAGSKTVSNLTKE